MNFIAGCLLLFLDEEDAFWALAAVVEDLLPGYFSLDMVAPQVSPPLPSLPLALLRYFLDVLAPQVPPPLPHPLLALLCYCCRCGGPSGASSPPLP